jgi:glutamyl-tRNA reductase
MRHLAGVLVHTPSARAKELAAAGDAERFAEAIETVYGLAPTTAVVDSPGTELAG